LPHVGSDDLERPWKAGRMGLIFQVDLCNYTRTIRGYGHRPS